MEYSWHLHNFLWFLIIGGLAGWIASLLVRGTGLGLLGDIVVGIIGSFVGGFFAYEFDILVYGFWGVLATSILGAVVLLLLARAFRTRRR